MLCLKKYSRRNNVSEFREFYIQEGAGSNFLASKCLWAEDKTKKIEIHKADSSVNEFFYHRAKTPAEWTWNPQPKGLAISSPEKIKTVLTELHLWINKNYKNQSNFESENRERVIRNIDNLWTEDWSYWTFDFFAFMDFEKSKWKDSGYPTEVINMIHQAQDCFATCREYYFKRCQEKNWDTFLITHSHPFLGISPRIKLPENFKTLSMELDVEVDMFCAGLQDLKSSNGKSIDEIELKFEQMDDLFSNMSVSLSDDKVSYRKIFFENDEDEIRKMYNFFDNEEYFEENKTNIMSEFREYHDKNMSVIQKFAPGLYNQLKTR